VHGFAKARYGPAIADALGLTSVPFLSWSVVVAVLLGGGAMGALAAMAAIGRRVLVRQ
jgi:hypothetical protein